MKRQPRHPLFRLLGLLLLIWPAAVQAQFTCTTNSDGSITVISYTGADAVIVVPDTINGCPVTGIASNAFHDFGTSITIPGTVTNLAGYAFSAIPLRPPVAKPRFGPLAVIPLPFIPLSIIPLAWSRASLRPLPRVNR